MWREQAAEGWLVHRRLAPRKHQFRYRVFYTLEEADPDCIRGVVAEQGLGRVDRVLRLGQRRALGARFNPVVFFFVLVGGRIRAVLAEINSTPWDERHTYVLDARGVDADGRHRFAKTFHVSPFNPMDLEYDWRFDVQVDRIRIDMRLLRGGTQVMYAGLDLATRPLDRSARLRGALRFPVQGWLTLARIYWQALRLWLMRVPFHPHPDRVNSP